MKKKPVKAPGEGDIQVPVEPKYETVGRCGYCLLAIECKQPGGTEGRHVGTLIPYGECESAKRRTE